MAWELVKATAAVAVLSLFLALILPSYLLPARLSGSNNALSSAEIIPVPGAVGPESLAFDPNGGGPYTGVADGRVLKWVPDKRVWVDFAYTSSQRKDCALPFAPEKEHVCGRPLGIRFDKKNGDLYIADAYLGLHVVGPGGGLAKPVVTEVNGQRLYFTNDMDIDEEEDVIYFTDTSTMFRRRQFISSVFSGDKTGRLLKYNRTTKETQVLLTGLAFANGVALNKDRTFLLVAETAAYQILRYWLVGAKAGTKEIFAKLPGFPDNIRRNPNGEFWVALHAKNSVVAEWILSSPVVGKMLLKLPLSFKQLHVLLVTGRAHATILKLGEEGEVIEVLEDVDGRNMRFPSEVEERDGKLWIGSVMLDFVGVHKLERRSSSALSSSSPAPFISLLKRLRKCCVIMTAEAM